MEYNWPEDGTFMPFKSRFDEWLPIVRLSGHGAVWSHAGDYGQAGVWLRRRLKTVALATTWSLGEKIDTIARLLDVSKKLTMLVDARSGKVGVAQFYDGDGEMKVVEITQGEVTATLDLEGACERASISPDADTWRAYEGICRQAGHPYMILSLYGNARFR